MTWRHDHEYRVCGICNLVGPLHRDVDIDSMLDETALSFFPPPESTYLVVTPSRTRRFPLNSALLKTLSARFGAI